MHTGYAKKFHPLFEESMGRSGHCEHWHSTFHAGTDFFRVIICLCQRDTALVAMGTSDFVEATSTGRCVVDNENM